MIIRRGTYNGINWYIGVNLICAKTAYIAISHDDVMRLFGSSAKDIIRSQRISDENISRKLPSIHGGCTYLNAFLMANDVKIEENSLVIGWDYAHFDDIVFTNFTIKYPFGSFMSRVSDNEIEADIKNVIDDFSSLSKTNHLFS